VKFGDIGDECGKLGEIISSQGELAERIAGV